MNVNGKRTKFYFTDYVNHAIRFYLSSPDKIPVSGKSSASLKNWVAAQSVLYRLKPEELEIVKVIFDSKKQIPGQVTAYCQQTGADEMEMWNLVTGVVFRVAKARGLV